MFHTGLASIPNWLAQAQWLLAAPRTFTYLATVGMLLLGALVWPRGCCKEDNLFRRRVL